MFQIIALLKHLRHFFRRRIILEIIKFINCKNALIATSFSTNRKSICYKLLESTCKVSLSQAFSTRKVFLSQAFSTCKVSLSQVKSACYSTHPVSRDTHFHKGRIPYSRFQCNPRWSLSSWGTTWHCAIPTAPCSSRTWRTDCSTTSAISIPAASPRWTLCTWFWKRSRTPRSIGRRSARVDCARRWSSSNLQWTGTRISRGPAEICRFRRCRSCRRCPGCIPTMPILRRFFYTELKWFLYIYVCVYHEWFILFHRVTLN